MRGGHRQKRKRIQADALAAEEGGGAGAEEAQCALHTAAPGDWRSRKMSPFALWLLSQWSWGALSVYCLVVRACWIEIGLSLIHISEPTRPY